jgi:hypothetical protein
VLPIYLLGFPLVALWVLNQLSSSKDDDLIVFLAVAVVYALIWPVALPIDLGSWLLKRVKNLGVPLKKSFASRADSV